MPENEIGFDLEELADGEELKILKAEAARRGITPQEMAKLGIQKKLTERTRPKAMTGTVQAFRRRD
jgi:hypothetical protein